jgi:hypothetical protein
VNRKTYDLIPIWVQTFGDKFIKPCHIIERNVHHYFLHALFTLQSPGKSVQPQSTGSVPSLQRTAANAGTR